MNEILFSVLEAAREEVSRRLTQAGLPLTTEADELKIVGLPERGGRTTEVERIRVGGLYSEDAMFRITDRSVPLSTLGLKNELLPLAKYLAETTDLATRRYNRFIGEGQDLAEALLTHCVSPLATHYLRTLPDLSSADRELALSLASDLNTLVSGSTIVHINHLPISGVVPSGHYQHREVSIRPLTPRERGSYVEINGHFGFRKIISGSDYRPFAPVSTLVPSALLEVRTTRPLDQEFDRSSLPAKVALAFLLAGHDMAAPGYITNYDWPGWAALGRWNTPFPVEENRAIVVDKVISDNEFRNVIDLAYKIPNFGGVETNGRQIVLTRMLRALGSRSHDSGFLDLITALEATLLPGIRSELSFRFSIYGALFLQKEFDGTDTFRKLKKMYEIRSRLVHGGDVRPDVYAPALADARELARAVVRKSLESGWPDPVELDRHALMSTED